MVDFIRYSIMHNTHTITIVSKQWVKPKTVDVSLKLTRKMAIPVIKNKFCVMAPTLQ